MRDWFAHCENLVRAADKDRFLASLFAPAERRGHLHALYAFNIEIGRVREVAREPLAGEIRLQWWRDAIEGTRAGEARGHPVAAALLDTIARHRLPRELLLDLIEARSFDLYDDPMPSLDALETFARRTSSSLIELAARVLDPEDRGETDLGSLAAPAGIAYAVTGLLRAFPLHAAQRRLYLPAEMLDRHGVDAADIFAGRSTAALGAALAELRGHVRRHLDALRPRIATASPAMLPALLPVALVRLHLDRMERGGYDPFRSPVDAPQWRRQWALWRAARRPAVMANAR